MSGIAEVLAMQGFQVSGSDIKSSAITRRLESLQVRIYYNHHASHIQHADVVVYSSAIAKNNPEVIEAVNLKIPVVHRSEMLAELIRAKYGILIAGTHGKTTTTSMVANMLQFGQLKPSVIIGGQFKGSGSTSMLGEGEFLVCEADESDGSFLALHPTIAVITNIDEDHMDHYRDVNHIRETFLAFLQKIPFYGVAILNGDDEHIKQIIPQVQKKIITFGNSPNVDYQFEVTKQAGSSMSFNLREFGNPVGEFEISIPGIYNVYNCTASIALSRFLGISFEKIRQSMSAYQGIVHRFSILGIRNDIIYVDDYAHNPQKIKSVLKAVKSGWNRRTIAICQPHRFTRLEKGMSEFKNAFFDADIAIITDVYSAGELPIDGINAKTLVKELKDNKHPDARYISQDKLLVELSQIARPNDFVISLGAGDLWKIAHKLYEPDDSHVEKR